MVSSAESLYRLILLLLICKIYPSGPQPVRRGLIRPSARKSLPTPALAKCVVCLSSSVGLSVSGIIQKVVGKITVTLGCVELLTVNGQLYWFASAKL